MWFETMWDHGYSFAHFRRRDNPHYAVFNIDMDGLVFGVVWVSEQFFVAEGADSFAVKDNAGRVFNKLGASVPFV